MGLRILDSRSFIALFNASIAFSMAAGTRSCTSRSAEDTAHIFFQQWRFSVNCILFIKAACFDGLSFRVGQFVNICRLAVQSSNPKRLF